MGQFEVRVKMYRFRARKVSRDKTFETAWRNIHRHKAFAFECSFRRSFRFVLCHAGRFVCFVCLVHFGGKVTSSLTTDYLASVCVRWHHIACAVPTAKTNIVWDTRCFVAAAGDALPVEICVTLCSALCGTPLFVLFLCRLGVCVWRCELFTQN